MKKNAVLFLIIMVAFTGIAWFGVFNKQANDAITYEQLCADGSRYAEKGIFIDAVKSYESALAMNPGHFDLAMKVADMYRKLNDVNGLLLACDNAIHIDGSRQEPYVMKINCYMSQTMYAEAVKTLDGAKGVKERDQLDALSDFVQSQYTEKFVSCQEIGDWHTQGKINYVAVCIDDKWGMVQKDGMKKIKFIYDYIGAYSQEEEVIPCCFEGEYYYIDVKGNKKLVGNREYQYLGSFGEGYAPAMADGLYGYINRTFEEVHFEYEYAGAFSGGVAAVKKEGKWALIDTHFDNVTDFEYDQILVDSNGFCCLFGTVILRKGAYYYLYDVKAGVRSANAFDAAKMAASPDGAIAVKLNNRWGFSDHAGEMLIQPEYEDACSFSLGFAPVKKDGQWGYINEARDWVIEAKYTEAKPFSSDGAAPVKTTYAGWNIIVLCRYE